MSKVVLACFGAVMVAASVGCSSSSTASSDAAVGGPVVGELDVHCAPPEPVITVNPDSCTATPPVGVDEEAPVLFNSMGADDDCKYQISFTTTPVRRNENVTFKVTVKALAPAANNAPVTGANVSIEGVLGALHPLPNPATPTTTTESPSGVYTIGPIVFDQAGDWTVRFHLFESCHDLPESPHGHVAFHLDVP